MAKIARALLSVSDKTGLVGFARQLHEAGIELISTGGTAAALRKEGLPTIELSDYTGFPEMLDGRVKTLHPKVHGGLLFRREDPSHVETAARHGIHPIDLVVVNLYPFEATVARAGSTFEEAVENIDIGGPSMLRSAAKNHESVTVVTDPADYGQVLAEIASTGGTTLATRRRLAAKVFARTATYDAAIAARLAEEVDGGAAGGPPPVLVVAAAKAQALRYGENPHQPAALFGRFHEFYEQLHGKELSYNNVLDLTAAAGLILEFHGEGPALAILKHTNPCGAATGATLAEAWEKAFATDKQAPFGGIIAVNRPLDAACAGVIAGVFSEVVAAPDFTPEALAILQAKKNLRLVRWKKDPRPGFDLRGVGAGSYLWQGADAASEDAATWKVVTRRAPTDAELAAMKFGWRVVKHIKSNAILYCGSDRTLGVGAGQMSRVDSSRIAVWKAAEAGLPLRGSVVCSDAFFPFADGLIAAAQAGATAAIQPGGSVRDEEVIRAADENGMAMVFTGRRHFRH
jgi:phosphoribosylaminoimidazolecarboxamide formyltransferase / IMP cyclohydrolase